MDAVYDGSWFLGELGGPQQSSTSCYAGGVASPSGTSSLSSPSSGYSSADEGRATPVQGEADWAECLLSSDPYLGELVMTPTNSTRRRTATEPPVSTMSSSWSGSSLVLDDFMDTLWDSLTTGPDTSTRPLGSDMVVDSSSAATRLTQHYPLTTSSTISAPSYGCSTTSERLDSSPSNVDDGLRTSSSGSVFVGRPLPVDPRRRLSGSSHQHHLAGLMDMVTSDADDYVFKRDMPPPAVPMKSVPGAARLVGGVVLGQRSAACAPSSRVRGAVLAKSCGDALLKRAAVRISTSAGHSATSGRSQPSVRSRGNPPSSPAQRTSGVRSASLSLPSSQLSGSAAGRVPSYLALDDHRYTLRVPPPPNPNPPPSKVQKTGSRSSGMRQSACNSGSMVGVTSILEAFLRTTRPIDPNKGSNAALAAAGLGHLSVGGDRGAVIRGNAADHVDDDDDGSGTLLKKLLTGEIDQSSFSAGTDTSSLTRTASQVEQTDTMDSGINVMDSLLAEEFCFDGDLCLDDSQSMSLSLLDDDGLWISAQADDFEDKLMSYELDEILREQNRQDDLTLQHYISGLL